MNYKSSEASDSLTGKQQLIQSAMMDDSSKKYQTEEQDVTGIIEMKNFDRTEEHGKTWTPGLGQAEQELGAIPAEAEEEEEGDKEDPGELGLSPDFKKNASARLNEEEEE